MKKLLTNDEKKLLGKEGEKLGQKKSHEMMKKKSIRREAQNVGKKINSYMMMITIKKTTWTKKNNLYMMKGSTKNHMREV